MIDLYFKLIPDAPELPVNDIYEVVTYIMDMTIKGRREQREQIEEETREAARQGIEYVPEVVISLVFDYEQDYRIIWDSFKAKRGIDLNKDKVTWWEFTTILEAMRIESIITPDSKSSFESLKAIRAFEESPDTEQSRKQEKLKYNAFRQSIKLQYALKNNEEQTELNNQSVLGTLKDFIIANIEK